MAKGEGDRLARLVALVEVAVEDRQDVHRCPDPDCQQERRQNLGWQLDGHPQMTHEAQRREQ